MAVLHERRGAVAIVTISRPEARNSWGEEFFEQLIAALAQLADDDAVNCVIITGDEAGKAFSAGANLRDTSIHAPMAPADFIRNLPRLQRQSLPDMLADFPKPLVAAVNGYAIGAGCVIACCCDVAIASDRAEWRLSHVNLGIMPQFGTTTRIARSIGRSNAMKLALGFPIKAEEGLRMGLAQWLVPHDKLMAEAVAIAEKIAGLPPLAVRAIKETTNAGSDAGSLKGMVVGEAYRHLVLRMTGDNEESHNAWREGRTPVFKGR